MAGKTGFRVEVLRNDLKRLPSRVRSEVADEVEAATAKVERDAERRVPVDSGDLKRSIRRRIEDGGLTGVVEASEFYGRFQEYGTRHHAAQPFMRPAAEAEKRPFRARVRAILKALGVKA